MRDVHSQMVQDGAVVTVPKDVISKVSESYPDLRSMKKKQRTAVLKEAIKVLKTDIRRFLDTLKNQKFDFNVNGSVLEAKLYNTGVKEVLEKITQEKANMLYVSERIFKNARYLYSTSDYDNTPGVLRWNYFYSPVKIGDITVGVRVAVRDVDVRSKDQIAESQLYNWNIKKDATLDGGSSGPKVDSSDVSSDASNIILQDTSDNVKQKQLEIIRKTNPAPNEYSTWVRTVEDIKTLAETLEDDEWADYDEINPDLTADDIREAVERGSITVYSSYPIENGVFVSPSRMEAKSYSGTGEVYEKTVDIRDVAWIDPTQGQYAKVEAEMNIKVDYSLSPETDVEYLSAVESGDTETAQRLVDEAAEAALNDSKIRDSEGKLAKVYHGSEAEDFSVFDKNRRGQTDSSMYGRGYYFAFDSDYSSDFGDNIRTFYLNIKNPYYIDINAPASVIADFLKSKGVEVDFDYSNMISHFFAKNFGSQRFTDALVKLGYDGVVVRTDEGENFETVAFHRNQMKLADEVTYDDNGNVIPLSERFDENKTDIRFQAKKKTVINTDYSDLSRLDAESLKVYNDRGWAMSLFTNEDKALLSQRLGEIFYKDSKYVRTTLGDGTVVLDLNNKMLLVSGEELGKEVIHGVVAINAPSESYAVDLKEDIISESENSWYDRETFSGFLQFIQRMPEAENFRFYYGNDFYYKKGTHDTGDRATLPDEWENFGFTTGKQNRRRVSSEAQSGVPETLLKVTKFQHKSLDALSDTELLARHLEENSEAVG